jgi:hypothetical protein
MQKNSKQTITQVNEGLRGLMNTLADMMLMSEADQWAYLLSYFPRDIMNAVYIFQHVVSNVGIKQGRIDEKTAVEYGHRLSQLVSEMTGYTPADWMDKELKDNENRSN